MTVPQVPLAELPGPQGAESNPHFVWGRNDGLGMFTILDNLEAGDGDFLQGVAIERFRSDDGRQVALSWHDATGGVQSLAIPPDPSNEPWTLEQMSTVGQGEDLSAGDIDHDDDPDLLLGTKWLRNDGESWTAFSIEDGSEEPDRNQLADIDGDGRLDAVVGFEAISALGKLAWYEQSGSAGSASTARLAMVSKSTLILAPQKSASVFASPSVGRVIDDLQVLYTFEEDSGTIAYDVSGVGTPLDLHTEDASAISWANGALIVHQPALIASDGPASNLIEAARTSDEVTIEAWIKPANTTQDGPARIVTLSQDLYNRNFTLGQGFWGTQPSALYNVRFRTTDTNPSGQPPLTTMDGSLSTDLTHVVYTRDASGIAKIFLNGVPWASKTVGGDLSNWNDTYRLALANEFTGDRPWLGEFHLVAIYSHALTQAEVEQNFQAGAQ